MLFLTVLLCISSEFSCFAAVLVVYLFVVTFLIVPKSDMGRRRDWLKKGSHSGMALCKACARIN